MRKIYLNDGTNFEVGYIDKSGDENLIITTLEKTTDELVNIFENPKNTTITVKEQDGLVVAYYEGYTKVVESTMTMVSDKDWNMVRQYSATLSNPSITTAFNSLRNEVTEKINQTNEVQNQLSNEVQSIKQQLNENINTDIMTVDEYRNYKKQLIGAECRSTIYDGVYFMIDSIEEHFTYNAEDQINFTDMKVMCDAGFPVIPYHSSAENNTTNPCKFYNSSDIVNIYMLQVLNKMRHTTKCNAIYQWLDSLADKSEMETISFSSALPTFYQEKYDDMIQKTEEMMSARDEKPVDPEPTPEPEIPVNPDDVVTV